MSNPQALAQKKIAFFLSTTLILFLSFLPAIQSRLTNWGKNPYRNENIQSRIDGERLVQIFSFHQNHSYIPLTELTFALERKLPGHGPFLYHVDNFVLHILVVLLIFSFSKKLGLSDVGAWAAAVLFGIHPLRVEVLAALSEREYLLSGLFFSAGLNYYWNYAKEKKWKDYFWAVVCAFLAVLSSPVAVSFPFTLILCDWLQRRKLNKQVLFEKIPFLFCSMSVALISQSVIQNFPPGNFSSAVAIWIWGFAFYIKQFILPGVLVPIYSLPLPVEIAQPAYILSMIIILSLAVLLLGLRHNRRFVFCILFYLFTIIFVLSWSPKKIDIVSDRYMYLPAAGFCILWGAYWDRIWDWARSRRLRAKRGFIVGSFIFLMGILAFRTFLQSEIWSNSLSLWQYQLLFNPHPSALNHLASAYRATPNFFQTEEDYRKIMEFSQEGVSNESFKNKEKVLSKIEQIKRLYSRSIAMDPANPASYYELAGFYDELGQKNEAIAWYEKIFRLTSDYKEAGFLLGKLYVETNQPVLAVNAFNAALQNHPKDAELYMKVINTYAEGIKKNPSQSEYSQAISQIVEKYKESAGKDKDSDLFYLNLGNLYQEIGDTRSAKAAYELSLDMNPNSIKALSALAKLYDGLGQNDSAIEFYKRVVGISPYNDEAYFEMGNEYSRMHNIPKAIEYFEEAVKINPKKAEAYFNLGFIYEAQGNAQKAAEYYEKAAAQDPRNAEIFFNLGNVDAFLAYNEKAVNAYKRAIEINPEHVNALVNLSILSFKEKDYAQAIKYCDEARVLGYNAPIEYLDELDKHRETKDQE